MPDEPTKDVLGNAVTWLGGTGVLAGLGVLLRGLLSGAVAQEKEMREDLRVEVKRLRDDLSSAQDEIDELREDVKRLSRMYLHVLSGRAEARVALNALEKAQGMTPTDWPPDPPESLGGTP